MQPIQDDPYPLPLLKQVGFWYPHEPAAEFLLIREAHDCRCRFDVSLNRFKQCHKPALGSERLT